MTLQIVNEAAKFRYRSGNQFNCGGNLEMLFTAFGAALFRKFIEELVLQA